LWRRIEELIGSFYTLGTTNELHSRILIEIFIR
jgi:hypothetical protein